MRESIVAVILFINTTLSNAISLKKKTRKAAQLGELTENILQSVLHDALSVKISACK